MAKKDSSNKKVKEQQGKTGLTKHKALRSAPITDSGHRKGKKNPTRDGGPDLKNK